jgi:hypothetical protein
VVVSSLPKRGARVTGIVRYELWIVCCRRYAAVFFLREACERYSIYGQLGGIYLVR